MGKRQKRIALLHHTGGGNLGDDATMEVVLRNVGERWPEADVTVFTMNPDDTAKKHGIPSYPIRRHTWKIGYNSANMKTSQESNGGLLSWLGSTRNPLIRLPRAIVGEIDFLIGSLKRIWFFDLLIIGGGGQLTERSGPWGFPYAIFIWVLMSRAARVKCFFLNVGAGPLRHPLSKLFVKCALISADYVSFRDVQSQALAVNIGYKGESQVFPDNVYDYNVLPPRAFSGSGSQQIVGIAPMPYPFCDPREHLSDRQAIYDDLTAKIAKFATAVVQRSYSIELFGSDYGADPSAIEDLRAVLQQSHNIITPEYVRVESVRELLARMSAMDYVVTCRFHGVVFAHLLNKPVLAISHHPKVANLMNTLGLSEYCFDIEKFYPEQLTDAFESMVRNADEIKRSMAASLAHRKMKLKGQFDYLFPPDPREARGKRRERTQVSGVEGGSW
jgi:polysaccharide pyruvyl transferase WcaK-like protein